MPGKRCERVGVLTSGGDAPGMNACIRAIARTAIYHGLDVIGFRHGYTGVLADDYVNLTSRSVSNIIQRGGTLLRSSRCEEFQTGAGQLRAAKNLEKRGIDALLVIGGDGSLRGAHELLAHWGGQVVGLPGTIDNDLFGTDWTIGFFTAVNTALESLDKIRDTADAFERVFIVEVMGHSSGHIALAVGTGSGAEEVLIPEEEFDLDGVVDRLVAAKQRGKSSYIIIVAEGVCDGGAVEITRRLGERTGLDCRACVLGHIQRGGSPAAQDRILATKLGCYAVEAALKGASDVMAGMIDKELALTPLEQTWSTHKPRDTHQVSLSEMLRT